jgi:ABC-type glutathione transport system ATPase component
MTLALEINNLHVTATGQPSGAGIVRGVSLVLAAGERLTILGESGSGKSILAQAIMGTLPPGMQTRGDIAVWGQPVVGTQVSSKVQPPLWGRQLAMLPQEPWLALNPTMRLHHQVAEVPHFVKGQAWPAARQAADRALAQLHLEHAARKYPHQVSGGMAQRVSFAATCAAGAQLLIADEPTKGLDTALRDQVADLLAAHVPTETTTQEAPHALITITHDVALAQRLGGTVAIMLDGLVIEHGPASEVLLRPQHAYSRALVQANPSHWHSLLTPVAADAAPVVQASGLAKSFGAENLFSGLDLSIAQGEIVAVTGPSGCGKTTLGHILLGVAQPDAGTVSRPAATPPHAFQKLYQDPPAAFAPSRSLRQCLNDLITLHKRSWADANELMRELKLGTELLDRLPDQVSGGELQRFALLRVLLLQPRFIFADEPTSRLDPIIQKVTMALLCASAAAHRFGVILVTHDAAVAANAAHRVERIRFGAQTQAMSAA